MRRRTVIAMLGAGLAVRARAASAQQAAMPVIGFLNGYGPDDRPALVQSFRQALLEHGFVEGGSVAIQYRWAQGDGDRLHRLAADLVERRVAVIVACGGDNAAQAAKAATQSIAIVAVIGRDPVKSGLAASLDRPGGNVTGVNLFSLALLPKRLELLHELVPAAPSFALLTDPSVTGKGVAAETEAAARRLGVTVSVLNASTLAELDAAFATLGRDRPGGLLVAGLPFFDAVPVRRRLVALAAQYAIPTMYDSRAPTEAGGLISYSTSFTDIYHELGILTGRILQGEKPADLPISQPTNLELVINLKTAKALHLALSPLLLARADTVIE